MINKLDIPKYGLFASLFLLLNNFIANMNSIEKILEIIIKINNSNKLKINPVPIKNNTSPTPM